MIVFNRLTILSLSVAASLAGPLAAKENAVREPARAQIPPQTFNVTSYGAVGDGVKMNTAAFRAAVQACAAAGGGRVVVPPGTYLTGPIELASRTALVLEKGATIRASSSFSDFGLPDPLPDKQAEIDAAKKLLHPLISGTDLQDVAILGAGVIDGGGPVWWAKSDKAAERAAKLAEPHAAARPLSVPRPYLVTFRNCVRVCVQGVTLRDSPMFHLVPSRCQDVLIEDISIIAPADSPNTDGIDPANCRDVLIRRCRIDTGDDNIALKAGAHGGVPTENITVADCTFLHGHGVSVGSETDDGVRNFLVERCTFENTGTALRIKSGRTRGGLVENVTYRDIKMKNVECAITIFLFYEDKKEASKPEWQPVTKSTPTVRDIHFQNIVCEGTTKKAGEIAGLPESPVTDVVLENVRITGAADPFTTQNTRRLRFLNVDVQTAIPQPEPAKP